jgi:hypothetical protein
MEILEVNSEIFNNIIPQPYYIFGQSAFADLNKNKTDKLFFLLFKEHKYRLGIIGGVQGNAFYSPFSAPFGGFVFLNQNIKIEFIDSAICLLIEWAENHQLKSLNITLPPIIYNQSFLSKLGNSLFRNGFNIRDFELNYSFHLSNFSENYENTLHSNTRRNLRISMQNGLDFIKCKTLVEKRDAFEVIRKNREVKNFPLRMTWEQLAETIQIIPVDFFMVYDNHQTQTASAIVYHVNQDIVQVVYWGEDPAWINLKVMNFLSFKVFEYYKSTGKKIVDIGPSTENSVPNYGLCEFKESIGCDIDEKFVFVKKLN